MLYWGYMGEDTLQDAIDELIVSIDSYETISAAGTKDAMFPDDLIAAIHNHAGNTKQYVSSAEGAFNGVEQSLAYKSAQKELEALSNSLFAAQQTGLIGQAVYDSLAAKVRHLIDRISDVVDPEYV